MLFEASAVVVHVNVDAIAVEFTAGLVMIGAVTSEAYSCGPCHSKGPIVHAPAAGLGLLSASTPVADRFAPAPTRGEEADAGR
jgi:hypothetical protein